MGAYIIRLGSMNSAQTALQKLLDQLVNEDVDRGLQLAVYHHGELVIDAWSGVADEAGESPVDARTLFPVFSCTKGVFSTVMHRLVDRGLLEYDVPLVEYWPEFGVNGKDKITLRHVMSHSAGVPQIPSVLESGGLADWDRTCAAIAELTPLWEPGKAQQYHALTMGYLMAEPARRVTGLMPDDLLRREIIEPAGIEDMHLGLPVDFGGQVAWLEEVGPDRNEEAANIAVPLWLWPLHEMLNSALGRRTPNPASNGIMSARALAKKYAALTPSGVDGIHLLSPERIAIATQRYLVDNDPEKSLKFAFGYEVNLGERPTAFGHGGYGGAMGFVELETGLAFGFARNRLRNVNTTVDTTGLIIKEVREQLGLA